MTASHDFHPGVSAWRLAALNLLVFAPVGVQLPFLSLWYASIGFGAESIALIQGATPIARFVSNLVVPPLADRRGEAAALLALCAAGMTAGSALAGLVQPSFGLVFLVIVATAFAQGPMIALADSMTLREARRRVLAGERPLDYGIVRGAGSLAVFALMVAGGWFVGLVPQVAMIFIIAGVMAATVPGILLLSSANTPAAGSAVRPPRERIAHPRQVGIVVLGAALIQASHAIVYTFGSIDFRAHGHSDAVIGLLWAMGVATEVAFFVLSNRWFGGASRAYALLAAGGLFAVLRWLMMASTANLALIFLAQALHALSFASTHLGSVYALTRLVGETRRAQAQGWLAGANALTYAAVAIACGPLWKNLGAQAYFVMAAIAAAGLACVAVAALEPRKDG